jgi:NAD(P)-dependent dehydrogenase (short-subunit alcohol dehydrogenase family)
MATTGGSLTGKVVLVTGATSGIGTATAEGLARQGPTLVLLGRDLAKCAATADRLRGQSGNSAIEFLVADLSSQTEIRRVAGEFRERHGRLDVLVNNAGIIANERRLSPDGIELTFAVNHLAYFLLTHLLLDPLRASAPSRVVNVASDAHRIIKGLDFDDLQGAARYNGFLAYARSKLANILFTNELASRLAGTGVTANALHPGGVATNIFAGRDFVSRLARNYINLFGLSPEAGARTSVYLASSPAIEGLTGLYFVKCKAVPPSAAARDKAAARRLWDLSESLTGLASSPES